MDKSESIGKLAVALVAAQAELKNPGFDSENPHFRSRFVSLAALRDAVMPVLNKHGIAVVQGLEAAEGGVSCRTMLLHTSGEWVSAAMVMPAGRADPQGYAAASTYARRYWLQSMLCVVGDEDDDGNAAQRAATLDRTAAPPEDAYDRKPARAETRPDGQPIEDPQGAEPEEGLGVSPVDKARKQATAAAIVAGARTCPKCGKTLGKRTAKRGPNMGREFYACPGYPDCKHTEAV